MRRVAFLSLILILCGAYQSMAQARLRPGDTVDLRLAGVPADETQQFSGSYTLDQAGMINLPYIGQVKAGGDLVNQVQSNIENKLRTEGIYTHPTITIQTQAGQRFVNVGGSVRSPGRIIYTPDLTLMSAINAAGGPGDFAKQGAFLTRGGKRVYYDLKQLKKDPSQDPAILPGDQIEVPQSLW